MQRLIPERPSKIDSFSLYDYGFYLLVKSLEDLISVFPKGVLIITLRQIYFWTKWSFCKYIGPSFFQVPLASW